MYEFTESFESPVNLRRVFDATGIEYLEVTEERVVALVDGEVVQLTALDGTIEGTGRLQARIFGISRSTISDWAGFADRFKARLDRTERQQ